MLYAILCHDKAASSHIRAENRPLHLEYLKANNDNIHAAGPLMGDDEQSMVGSLLIMNYESKAEAETFAAGDPYAKAGLFESVTITPWKQVIPAL
ncbi:MAG: YciI family protein [Rhodospirillales bacterium]|nr:YciI family protein [Rhodospirillales bacterium]